MSTANRLLFGTDEPQAALRTLRAGLLSADLEQGNLRAIRFGGVELIRAISFLIRSPRWATYAADIADLEVTERADAFQVAYRADVRDGDARLAYSAEIEGRADGTLRFACTLATETEFTTCRAGFVVLHAAGVAGLPVTVEHTDGSVADSAFPRLIDPLQPMFDLRALTHAAAPGLVVTCRMEGDAFEMEDQRNWTDASFKTYVRPLSRPWPFVLPAGARETQSVTLEIRHATAAAAPGGDAEGPVRVTLGDAIGAMPPLGLGCTPAEARAGLPHAATLVRAGVACLVGRFDPGEGHAVADLADLGALARAIGAELELQIVVHSVSGFADELAQAAASARAAGLTLARIAVSPAPDLKSVTPGQPWPACAPLDDLYAAARAAFPGVPLAGGTFAYFTELNRKRPPLALLDAVTFSTSPIVHAADDRSVMESLEALPAVAESARAIAGDRALLVGPSAIGFRGNPYGPTPLANPDNIRLPMSGADPRQRGLFNAAWTLGYVARFAEGGAARIAVSAPAGAHGILDADGVWPVFAVLRGLAALRGATRRAALASRPADLVALLAERTDGPELWLANLTGATLAVALPAEWLGATLHRLDASTLASGAAGPDALTAPATETIAAALTMGAYAVWRCLRPG